MLGQGQARCDTTCFRMEKLWRSVIRTWTNRTALRIWLTDRLVRFLETRL